MIKKIFTIISLLLLTTPCFAKDYWVYIRTYDRSGVTAWDDVGRSKDGDIVQILPVTKQYTPSEQEKKEWLILRVSGLTKQDIQELTEPDVEVEFNTPKGLVKKPKSFRKRKLAYKLLTQKRKGIVPTTIKRNDFIKHKKSKTWVDYARYEAKRYVYLAMRPFKKLDVKNAFAENVSTINKTGEDYNTLTLWEDAKDGNLVSETRQETAECYDDDGALSDNVTIDGSTTNSTYYMKITVPSGERHDGTLPDGTSGDGFVLKPSSGTAITVNDGSTIIEWIAVDCSNVGAWSGYGIWLHYSDGNGKSYVKNCIVYDALHEGGIRVEQDAVAYNNIVYSSTNADSWYVGIYIDYASGSKEVYNNTVVTYGIGIRVKDNGSSCILKNNIAMDTGKRDFYFDQAPDTHTYNMSEDATADDYGSNNLINKTFANQFVNTSGDFHLVSTADAVDAGTDLSGTFTNDIDNDTRSGTWDIGADEYISSGGATRRIILIQ